MFDDKGRPQFPLKTDTSIAYFDFNVVYAVLATVLKNMEEVVAGGTDIAVFLL